MQQALKKLQAEIGANAKNKYVQVVGGFLITHVREHPEHAQQILTEGKTISGSLEAMRKEAEKNRNGQSAVLTSDEGFDIVLKYFGIKVRAAEPAAVPAAPSFDVSLDDLL